MAVPASRYAVSPRIYPRVEQVVAYDAGATTRKVCDCGRMRFRGMSLRVGKRLSSEHVERRPTETDGTGSVRVGHQSVWAGSLRAPP